MITPAVPAVDILQIIFEVPALNVKPVGWLKFNALELELVVTVLDLRFIVLMLELFDDREDAVTLKPFVSNVPFVIVKVLVPIFKASFKLTVPAILSIVTSKVKVFPALVID